MKQRHLYVLLFAVPALLVALVPGVIAVAAVAGGLWLFVYGDNAWPPVAQTVLVATGGITSLALWIWLLSIAYIRGRRREAEDPRQPLPVALAAGTTFGVIALVALHQWSVGNVGPKPDSMVCAEYCSSLGFAGSAMPPRDAGPARCSCLDAKGRETPPVLLQDAASALPKPAR
ncbi:MAG: hypothetical protein ABIU58_02440 [Ramlibacter sp.]